MKVGTLLRYRFNGSHSDTTLMVCADEFGRKELRVFDTGLRIGPAAALNAFDIGARLNSIDYKAAMERYKKLGL
jgi:hypothetical protein